jgi:hypothetical protein
MVLLSMSLISKAFAPDSIFGRHRTRKGWYGKLKNARGLTRRALDSAEHNDAEETATRYQLAAAKDADPDIPILIAAKAEYAKLH